MVVRGAHRRRRCLLLVVALTAVALNLVNNLLLDDRLYVLVNVGATFALLVWARASGMTWSDVGLSREGLPRGARLGLVAAAVITLVVVTLTLIPAVAHRFQVQGETLTATGVAWAVLARIPFGTALPEELLFRGLLLGLLLPSMTRARAVVWSSVPFGLWHVLPTLDESSAVSGGVGAVAGAVVLTTFAGIGFAALRIRAGSLLAPVLAHTAVNTSALLVAYRLGA